VNAILSIKPPSDAMPPSSRRTDSGADSAAGAKAGTARSLPGNTLFAASRRRRTPPHPGMFLESRFLKPLHISQETLARGLGVSRRRVNELIRGHRAITPDTAIRLGTYFRTGPEFWMNLQQAWDLYQAWRALRSSAADLTRHG
jgi:addiction module HigA family antidote